VIDGVCTDYWFQIVQVLVITASMFFSAGSYHKNRKVERWGARHEVAFEPVTYQGCGACWSPTHGWVTSQGVGIMHHSVTTHLISLFSMANMVLVCKEMNVRWLLDIYVPCSRVWRIARERNTTQVTIGIISLSI
jgi:hypothetical protein